jgi:hypothetical protein
MPIGNILLKAFLDCVIVVVCTAGLCYIAERLYMYIRNKKVIRGSNGRRNKK